MSVFEPKPFGKYFLTDLIAIGGMAEIYKAKTFGVDGFEKVLAIKKILTHYSADKEFITMLTDEAKLVVNLTHANIVQVYDLGRVGDDYFISMEYIDGINLRDLMDKALERGEKIPPEAAIYIACEVCKGLDYAHNKKDADGNPLKIVHRDISPHNILVSFDGSVKIVDFGIAKAAMNLSQTHAGMLKGKVTYMSPEQAFGKPIDGRTDLFSLGIVFYELLSGKRLFVGESQMEVLKKIRNTSVTEQFLGDDVVSILKPALVKALAYAPKNRYSSASDMQIDLTRLLYSQFSDFSPRRLSDLLYRWFKSDLNQTEEDISVYQETILVSSDALQNSPEDSSEISENRKIELQETITPDDQLKKESFFEPDDFEGTEKTEKSHKSDELNSVEQLLAQKKKRRIINLAKVALLFLILAVVVILVSYQKLKQSPVSDKQDSDVVTIESQDETDSPNTISSNNPKDKNTNSQVQQPVQKNTYSLLIQSQPPGAKIFIDDKNTGLFTPAQIHDLSLQQSYRISIRQDGFKAYEQNYQASHTSDQSLEVKLAPLYLARVQVESDPSDATIFINGEQTAYKTPFTFDKIMYPQRLKVKVQKEGFETFETEIDVSDAGLKTVQAQLKAVLN